jgi:hypothetical protein
MKSTGYVPTNKELAAIIRRLDLNADSRLSYEEFEEGIKPAEPYSRVLLGPCTKSTKLKKNMKKSKIIKKSLRSSSRSKLQRPKTAKSTMKIYSKYNSRKSKPRYQRSKNKKSLSR